MRDLLIMPAMAHMRESLNMGEFAEAIVVGKRYSTQEK